MPIPGQWSILQDTPTQKFTGFRCIIGFNLVRIALSWSAWFEGNATRVGAVDHLFGSFRLGGFRADVVWLVLSTLAIALAGLLSLLKVRNSQKARIDALLCAVEVLAFCSFVYRILTTGVLDFG
ncbi:phosphoglycerol transferase MdoB-like AlkP superfamily enzyme [Granulicella aggregans]|uniref:Phosphoglycerol transferase MdoB-like AlkP superfamily enzyme n=1 Tax=Granulicella aggregans TaxID=474949 RepID=A0A7W8E6P4_9BACT|nr:phosphoglycerol transferase MdoB-like AlkP superfamily enzyme [Granulicella aggregans]